MRPNLNITNEAPTDAKRKLAAAVSCSVRVCTRVRLTGYIPGHCISTSLLVDHSYIILATKQRNVYKARRTWRADWQRAYEIAQFCGLRKLYPFGMSRLESNITPVVDIITAGTAKM